MIGIPNLFSNTQIDIQYCLYFYFLYIVHSCSSNKDIHFSQFLCHIITSIFPSYSQPHKKYSFPKTQSKKIEITFTAGFPRSKAVVPKLGTKQHDVWGHSLKICVYINKGVQRVGSQWRELQLKYRFLQCLAASHMNITFMSVHLPLYLIMCS